MQKFSPPRPSFTIEALKGPALAIGVILLLVGIGSWLVNGFDTPTRILLAAGILLLGVFIAIDPEDIWRRLTTRSALYSGNSLLVAGAIIGMLGLINVVAQNRHQRWDLTANNQYSLSEQSLQVINNLPRPVQITAFYQQDDFRRQEAEDLLREYETRSGGTIDVEFVDPLLEPGRFQQAGLRELGTTLMTMGDQKQTVTGSRESDFTTALLRLTNPTQKKVYFLTGHNERRIEGQDRGSYTQIKTSIEGDNYLVEPLVLAGTGEVPEDADVLVLAQPRTPLSPDELQAIQTYLDNGGKLMILAEPSIAADQQPVNVGELVAKWGVEIGNAPVLEGNPQLAFSRDAFTPGIVRYPNHRITEGLVQSFFPTATYVNVPQSGQSDATITTLLETSDRSWAETSAEQIANPRTIQFDEAADRKGPLPIGVAIEDSLEQSQPAGQSDDTVAEKTRVVIFGDADFVANDILQLPVPAANRDLFVNAINWLAEEEQLISIRPKERDTRTMFLTTAQKNLALFSSTLFLPAIVLAIGGFVWWSRR